MPDKYIVNMTEKTAPEDTNLLVIEDAADTKKITFTNLLKPIKDMIGNLASLTTSHKSTLVGAINELQANNSLLYQHPTSAISVKDLVAAAYPSVPVGVHLVLIKREGEQLAAVIQKANSLYGSAIVFGYSINAIQYYRCNNGTWS